MKDEAASDRLVYMVCNDNVWKIISPTAGAAGLTRGVTLEQARSLAIAAAHPIHFAGVPAPRTPSGLIRRIAAWLKVDARGRQNVHCKATAPPLIQPLRLMRE